MQTEQLFNSFIVFLLFFLVLSRLIISHLDMDDFPELEIALETVNKMQEREEKELRVFPASVDPEVVAACACQHCPPRSTQEPGEYCCASIFTLQPLQKGILLRDGLLRKLKEHGSHPCITLDPLCSNYIMTEAAARSSAEMYSMLTGEPITDVNRSYRYGAYRLFVATSIGHLGKGIRIRLPSCFVHAVRQIWPSSHYRGFNQ
ncbi:hypothetical protein PRIPAC_88397 [Pristionchus pacificus]|nr:hypothetical protein PRIPAC_88397 [Pristionchus pacificus]